MQRTSSNVSTRSSLVAFLHEHLGAIERNDVGPLIGQAALIKEHGAASVLSPAQMHAWLNAALACDAARLPGSTEHAAPSHARRNAPVR